MVAVMESITVRRTGASLVAARRAAAGLVKRSDGEGQQRREQGQYAQNAETVERAQERRLLTNQQTDQRGRSLHRVGTGVAHADEPFADSRDRALQCEVAARQVRHQYALVKLRAS